MKKGFTLVELAIVLIIIGLLIGGILVAQSMMDTAKIHEQVQQLQQFDVAVSNFKLNYVRLPGDNNRNGYIEDGNHCPSHGYLQCTAGQTGWEPLSLFPELSSTGHLLETYTFATRVGFGKGKPLPKAAIGVGGIVPISGTNKELLYMLGAIREDNGTSAYTSTFYASLFKADGVGAGAAQRGILSPQQALAIDKKIDDGFPVTGIVRAFYWGIAADFTYGSPPFPIDTGSAGAGPNCGYWGTYKSTSSTDPNCLISVASSVDTN